MKYLQLLFTFALVSACTNQGPENESTQEEAPKELSITDQYYQSNVNDSIESTSHGTVAGGTLENGTLIPFEGSNYSYFDASSYLGGRAFTHSKVAQITINAYTALEKQGVSRKFKVMELSRKNGGKLFPHRTHQNGLSADYMMPLEKEGKPYYELDNQGASHYLLDFDKSGTFSEDSQVVIDFDTAAKHILELERQARKLGMRIEKVIFNTFLKDELFATPNGKKLKQSGIYITQNLSPLINDLHDDHYHVDFTFLR